MRTRYIPYDKNKNISTSTVPATLAAGCTKAKKFHSIRKLTVKHRIELHELADLHYTVALATLKTWNAVFTLGMVGVVVAVLKKTELSIAHNTAQTKALPNLYCGGRLNGANVPSQSDSPCFLLILQLRNDITNQLVTCAVPGKASNHLLCTSSAFSQQQKVPPSNEQKKEHPTKSNST